MDRSKSLFVTAALLLAAATASQGQVSYKKQVAPILAASCNACHGGAQPQSGLITAQYAALMKGGRRGKSVVPKDAKASLLVQYIEGTKMPRMPIGGALKPAEIELIKKWISEGAKSDGEAAPAAPPPKIALKVKVLPQAAALAWSKDAKYLAVGTYQEVRIYEPATQNPPRVLKGPADVTRGLCFSPDGKMLAAAGGVPGVGGELKVWTVEDGKEIATLTGHSDSMYAVGWRADAKQLATCSYDKTVRLWDDLKPNTVRDLKEHAEAVFALAYSSNSKYLATGGADRSIRIWDPAAGKRLYTLTGHNDAVTAIAFHPTAERLASGSADKQVRIWNLKADSGESIRTLGPMADTITDVRYSLDGKFIAATCANGEVSVWNADNGSLVKTFRAADDAVLALCFRPDGQQIAVGGYDGSVKLFNPTDGKLASTLIAPPTRTATPTK